MGSLIFVVSFIALVLILVRVVLWKDIPKTKAIVLIIVAVVLVLVCAFTVFSSLPVQSNMAEGVSNPQLITEEEVVEDVVVEDVEEKPLLKQRIMVDDFKITDTEVSRLVYEGIGATLEDIKRLGVSEADSAYEQWYKYLSVDMQEDSAVKLSKSTYNKSLDFNGFDCFMSLRLSDGTHVDSVGISATLAVADYKAVLTDFESLYVDLTGVQPAYNTSLDVLEQDGATMARMGSVTLLITKTEEEVAMVLTISEG